MKYAILLGLTIAAIVLVAVGSQSDRHRVRRLCLIGAFAVLIAAIAAGWLFSYR